MRYWSNSDYLTQVAANRRRLQQVFFSLAAISLLLNYIMGVSITQMGANPLLDQEVDPVYILLMALGVPQFISGNAAPVFDALLFIACISSLLWTGKMVFPRCFCVLYFIHFTTYNMISGHHYTNIAVLIMSMAFLFSTPGSFATAFSGCRFLFCFMMFSAAVWKIVRGNIWHTDQTNMLLISTHLDVLALNKRFAFTGLLHWLLQHKRAAHLIWIALIMLEGSFIAGFAGYRWDRWLLACYLLFFTGGFLLFTIYNFENLVFLITLQPVLLFISGNKRLTVRLVNSNKGGLPSL